LRVVRGDTDDGSAAAELPLKHTRVEAEISGFVTRVKVTQQFTNPYDKPIEAVYVFPLPHEAAVSDMQIRIGDRVIKGEIKKREEARQIYEAAKHAGKTAALLEQERPNIFSQSVANILPGNDIFVEITYDDVLAYEKGGYEFAFPMVVGPRFIPGVPAGRQGGGWSPDTDQVPDASRITPPVLKPGERNGHDIEITVTLSAGVPVRSLRSPSHEILTDPALDVGAVLSGPCRVRLAPFDTIPNKDFVLRYDVAGPKPEMALLAHRGGQGGHFMLMFQPPEMAEPDTITPKEMVFVMDCSGSMSGEPIALSKKAVRHALKHLNPGDTFQIIRFSEAASPFAKEPLPNTPENVRRGLSYINGLEGEGGTMMIEGIKAALDYPHRENRLRIVCFMTDGYIGNEAEILAAIERKLGDDTRLFSFGVGSSVNRYLLDAMAEAGRGEVQYVLLNENPEAAVERFYERVRHPALTHIRVDWGALDVKELCPGRIRDLFIGQPICVFGRYDAAGRATLRIHAKVSGRDRMFEVPVSLPADAPENAAVAALWARARIKELLAEQYGGEDVDVVRAVTDLALTYRLMSPYTSFVVNEGGEVKTIQVPVEMPEGVSYEGVFGAAGDARACGAAAPACSVGRRVSAVNCLFKAAKAAVPASAAVATCEEVADRDETGEPPAAVPAKPFRIELSLEADGGTETIRITPAGEVWALRFEAGQSAPARRVLVRRLRRDESRELWAALSGALSEAVPTLTFPQAGRLCVALLDESGNQQQEATVALAPQGGTHSEKWQRVVERVRELGR
jgi:Ca-activated chloride channel family protein